MEIQGEDRVLGCALEDEAQMLLAGPQRSVGGLKLGRPPGDAAFELAVGLGEGVALARQGDGILMPRRH